MSHLAVVPIFVNAGAAILPAVIGGATQFVAALFRPREMVALVRRRPWVPAVVLAVLGLAGLGAWWAVTAAGAPKAEAKAADGPAPVDWGDVGRRIVAERLAVAGESPTKLKELWTFGAPRKDEDGEWGLTTWFLATPHVRDGVVYTASALASAGGQSGTVVAIKARSGEQLWRTGSATPGGAKLKPIYSSPALTDDGRWVVVGQGLHLDAGCSLLCLDAASGEVRWQVPTPLHLESSPAIHGDVAVIGAGAIEDAVTRKPTGDPGFVLAVRISTGQELWRYPLPDPESSPVFGDDGTVYVGSGFNGNALVALRSEADAELAGKSRLVWKVPSQHPVLGDVALAGDLVVAGTSNSDMVNLAAAPAGGVIAVRRTTGEV
ncbi:MAG TPA: PQQ-binding-like beta-propeller repeat protein, partial [Humisphaera sp.]